ncbi:TMEM165/GDT1 family protein [Celerinatantimonas sp. YJH-8]|uniref:TMEM165/GDT1 family protein n=1 Tax=Celerinatantimonas sp. YJH-8 TaxID=3228714 RepID=UPI0038C3E916
MEAFLTSAFSVALSELGDKTQLLAIILICRFRKPIPIIIGMIIATIANHLLAGYVGALISQWLTPDVVRWLVTISFLAVALWALFPDKMENDDSQPMRYGPLLTTLIMFFLAEIGDKTQIATMIMAAKYTNLWEVVSGSTVGLCIANIPVMLIGYRYINKLPMKWIRRGSCLLFLILSVITFFNH